MVEITAEMIENAETYIPLLEKAKLAEDIAHKCVKAVAFSYTPANGGAEVPMPPGAQEVPFLTSLCLMGTLVSRYLKQGKDWDNDVQMPLNVYDEWASSHVMNQLERLKVNKKIANRVYDMLYDYKDLRWMVRRDDRGVDFGEWRGIPMSALYLPLDLHVGAMGQPEMYANDPDPWLVYKD